MGGIYSRPILKMNEPTKQEFNSVIAQVAEFGTNVIQTEKKEPPWLVRNIDGFIYAVEQVREHIVCTVLVPIAFLNRNKEELESSLAELNQTSDGRYGYAAITIAGIPLFALSAYYNTYDFNVERDLLALEHYALYIINELWRDNYQRNTKQ